MSIYTVSCVVIDLCTFPSVFIRFRSFRILISLLVPVRFIWFIGNTFFIATFQRLAREKEKEGEGGGREREFEFFTLYILNPSSKFASLYIHKYASFDSFVFQGMRDSDICIAAEN